MEGVLVVDDDDSSFTYDDDDACVEDDPDAWGVSAGDATGLLRLRLLFLWSTWVVLVLEDTTVGPSVAADEEPLYQPHPFPATCESLVATIIIIL